MQGDQQGGLVSLHKPHHMLGITQDFTGTQTCYTIHKLCDPRQTT